LIDLYNQQVQKSSQDMGLIKTLKQLEQNIANVEKYLTVGTNEEKKETSNLIKRGTCFVAYSINNEIRFAPSRFLGYVYNELYKHASSEKDGRETNKAINEILQAKPVQNNDLEQKYFDYCFNLGIKPSENGAFGASRKFWVLKLTHDFQENEELTGEFPEGKVVERTHKTRERNTQVIQIAKKNFKRKHGRLFCQICGFDFEKAYGKVGKDFIEGHHTIAVSDMTAEHKTKPADIAILCSNCHRMVHKKRPWLTMQELIKLLPQNKSISLQHHLTHK
jgi:predicted HNH restriction endonuclease